MRERFGYERFGKRIFDLALAIVALAILAAPLALLALAIRIVDGAPVLFAQRRVGRNGEPFTIYKFRTFPVGAPELASADAGHLEPTRLGCFLRRTNIDELPQILNILTGDMSFVGPRPGLPSQVTQATIRRQNGADRLAPGLTGLAQLRGVTGMSEAEKAKNDGDYARSIGFVTDLGILVRTAVFICRRPPVY